jgi:hypothetical protein
MVNYIGAGIAGMVSLCAIIALVLLGSETEADRITKHCEQRGAFYVKDVKYECSKQM